MVKRILVTGGNGFIGSHLVKRLVDGGFTVIVPYIEIDRQSFFHRNLLHKKTHFIRCDITNYKKTFQLIKDHRPDFIFHLAARPIVADALENPKDIFWTNIMGTVNVLEAARKSNKISGIVVASSDKAYGKIPRAKETKPIGGDHPYETSKASADLIATTYFKTYSLPVVVTRFGNVYGEGDLNFSRIVPGIMKAITNKEVLEIRSNGRYIRDYVYVGDVVEAMMAILGNIDKVAGEAFNISSYENLSVLELVKRVRVILGQKVNYKILATSINEIPKQSVNFSKIKKGLGWKPKKNLADKTLDIFNWYKSYFDEKR